MTQKMTTKQVLTEIDDIAEKLGPICDDIQGLSAQAWSVLQKINDFEAYILENYGYVNEDGHLVVDDE